MTERRVWLPAAAVLAVIYTATLAPGVTFWDAGEFIAAAHSLGIPHPPGTPLFILLLHAWGTPWPDQFYATGMNLFSALATAAAGGASAVMLFRWLAPGLGSRVATAAAIGGAICAGSMYTAWSSATETEVYGASLALAAVTLLAAERGSRRLVAYCFGLAAALHVSALVAAPAAIVLAASDDGRFDRGVALQLSGAALAAMAVGTWNPGIALLAIVVLAVAVGHPARSEGSALPPMKSRSLASLGMTGLVLLGASPLLFMLVRARFDPGINQGNPRTIAAFVDVIARRQYDLAPLWPRRAPPWIQLGNWFEYADWQAALSLGPDVVPTVARTAVSLLFAGLAIAGAAHHRRVDRRSWRALLTLFVAGTVGVTFYLNLRAGPSFGWGVLPESALREARERDYFFVLGFWAAGLWAGLGAVRLALRYRLPVAAGAAIASLPIALNWSAVDRRAEPDASLAIMVARGLVEPLPERTVLFVAGDNDTYPVWYLREVLGRRADVALVTVPLVGAQWYVEELVRRHPDLAGAMTSEGTNARTIADAARDAGRPVAASITLDRVDRVRLNGCWRVIGMAMLDDRSGSNCLYEQVSDTAALIPVDGEKAREWVRRFGTIGQRSVKHSVDPVAEHFARMLDCPRRMLDSARAHGRGVSLDSTCNP
ncbi:MAG TPA: DUF2723 domain-containing protein [Gemmatimonadaceae bacterium]|nr:DUF2723 domain-containing protein [Gemmatimonadaceae bacterium]